jgi:hypothetical protein
LELGFAHGDGFSFVFKTVILSTSDVTAVTWAFVLSFTDLPPAEHFIFAVRLYHWHSFLSLMRFPRLVLFQPVAKGLDHLGKTRGASCF